jgi:hypothetical protein
MKKLLSIKPLTLSETAEHQIHTRKWFAVVILVIGGLLLAGRAPVPMSFSYTLLFFGHAGMLHQMYLKRDVPLAIVNVIWLGVDLLGFIRWWGM